MMLQGQHAATISGVNKKLNDSAVVVNGLVRAAYVFPWNLKE